MERKSKQKKQTSGNIMKKNIIIYCIILYVAFILGNSVVIGQTTLNEYIQYAIQHSPDIESKYNKYLATKENIKAKTALNDMEFSLNIFPEPMQNVNGEQVATVSLMQMFPWFGTLGSQNKQMQCMSKADYEEMKSSVFDIAYKVKTKYYDLLSNQEIRKIVKHKIEILDNIQEIFTSNYTNTSANGIAKSSVTDLVDLQMQREELFLQQTTLEDDFQNMKQQFNNLLHRDEMEDVILLDTLQYNSQDISLFTYDTIVKNNPQLNMLQASNDANLHAIEMQRKMSYPMIGVGLEYMINKETNMPKMEDMNGNNMFMAMFKLTLPIHRSKYKANINSVKYTSLSISQQYDYQKDLLRNDFLSLQQNILNKKKRLTLYDKQIELLETKKSLLENTYSTDQNSLVNIIYLQLKIDDYKINKINTITSINKSFAKLSQLMANEQYNITQ